MPKFCSKCGHQVLNPISDTFCANCGVSLRKYVVGVKDRNDEEPPKFKKCDCPCCKPEEHRHLRSQSLAPPMSPKTPTSERNRTVSDANIRHMAEKSKLQKDAKTGWLHKQSSDLLNSWKKRYFKLTFGILFYFTNPEDKKANGSIPLKNTNIEILKQSKPNSFRLTTSTNKSFLLAADSSEDMHDWIEILLDYSAVMYDPKLHGYRAEVVESNTAQTVPLDPLTGNNAKTLTRSNSSSAVAGKSSPFSFFRKKTSTKEISKPVVKSSSTSRIENISGPILTTRPNPIIIVGGTVPGKQEASEQQDALREMLFSPSPKAKVVKKGNFNACDTCGYESEAFLRYCGHCGCKLLQIAGTTQLIS